MNRGDVCISILVSVVLIPPWQGNVLKVAHCCYVIGPYSIGGSIPHGLLLFFNFFVGDFSVSNTCAPLLLLQNTWKVLCFLHALFQNVCWSLWSKLNVSIIYYYLLFSGQQRTNGEVHSSMFFFFFFLPF